MVILNLQGRKNDLKVSAGRQRQKGRRGGGGWLWVRNWAPDVRKCGDLLAPPLSTEDQTSLQPIENRTLICLTNISFIGPLSTRLLWWCQLIEAINESYCPWPTRPRGYTGLTKYQSTLLLLYAHGSHPTDPEVMALCQSALLTRCGCRGNCILRGEARHTGVA